MVLLDQNGCDVSVAEVGGAKCWPTPRAALELQSRATLAHPRCYRERLHLHFCGEMGLAHVEQEAEGRWEGTYVHLQPKELRF